MELLKLLADAGVRAVLKRVFQAGESLTSVGTLTEIHPCGSDVHMAVTTVASLLPLSPSSKGFYPVSELPPLGRAVLKMMESHGRGFYPAGVPAGPRTPIHGPVAPFACAGLGRRNDLAVELGLHQLLVVCATERRTTRARTERVATGTASCACIYSTRNAPRRASNDLPPTLQHVAERIAVLDLALDRVSPGLVPAAPGLLAVKV